MTFAALESSAAARHGVRTQAGRLKQVACPSAFSWRCGRIEGRKAMSFTIPENGATRHFSAARAASGGLHRQRMPYYQHARHSPRAMQSPISGWLINWAESCPGVSTSQRGLWLSSDCGDPQYSCIPQPRMLPSSHCKGEKRSTRRSMQNLRSIRSSISRLNGRRGSLP